MRFRRRFGLLIALLLAVIAAGTAGFAILEGWSLFDGLYMTVITLSTIGYGEIHPLSPVGRWFNIGLIVIGYGTLLALAGTATQALLEAELAGYFHQRQMERQVSRLHDHIIVCGMGRVGRAVAREFDAARVTYVVIEQSDQRARWALDRDTMLVIGDATQEEVLDRAGIRRARGLVAAVAGDAQNIYIALTARELNPHLKIVARAAEEGAEKTLRRAGADMIISPYVYSGHRLAQALLRPNVVDFLDNVLGPFDQSHMRLQIEEVAVAPSSPLAGRSLAESHVRRELGIIVLGIKRPNRPLIFNPPGEERLETGDVLIAMGETANLKRLEAKCLGGRA
jgi:voltage-gated potassium channel